MKLFNAIFKTDVGEHSVYISAGDVETAKWYAKKYVSDNDMGNFVLDISVSEIYLSDGMIWEP